MCRGSDIGVPADAIAEQLRPQFVVAPPTQLHQIVVRRNCRKQPENCSLRNLFTPVKTGATDQAQGVGILARQLPYESKPGGLQPVKVIGNRSREQIAAAFSRQYLRPQAVVSLTKRQQQKRRR